MASRRLGDFQRARTAYEQAVLGAEQSNPVLRDFYEEALRQGEFDECREELERFACFYWALLSVFAVLLVVEAALVLVDPVARRIGDRVADTRVIEG